MISSRQDSDIKEEDIQWIMKRSDDLDFLYKRKHPYLGDHRKEVGQLHSYIIRTCGSTHQSIQERFRRAVQAIYNHATIEAQRLKLTQKDGSGEVDWLQVITYVNDHKKKDFYLRELLGTLDQLSYAPSYQPFLNEDLKQTLNTAHIKLHGLTDHLLTERTSYTLFAKEYKTSGLPPAVKQNAALREKALTDDPVYTGLKELKLS